MIRKTSVTSLLAIVLAWVFAVGCSTNNGTDKATREEKADSVARSSQNQGEHGEGRVDDNRQGSHGNRDRDSMHTGMKRRGMGEKPGEGMMNK